MLVTDGHPAAAADNELLPGVPNELHPGGAPWSTVVERGTLYLKGISLPRSVVSKIQRYRANASSVARTELCKPKLATMVDAASAASPPPAPEGSVSFDSEVRSG